MSSRARVASEALPSFNLPPRGVLVELCFAVLVGIFVESEGWGEVLLAPRFFKSLGTGGSTLRRERLWPSDEGNAFCDFKRVVLRDTSLADESFAHSECGWAMSFFDEPVL